MMIVCRPYILSKNSLIQNNQNLYVAFIDLILLNSMLYNVNFWCMIFIINCKTRANTFNKMQNK